MRTITKQFIAAGLALLAAACSDDEPANPADKAAEKGAPSAAHREAWLQHNSKITPAQWLASRHEAELRPVNDPAVVQIAQTLDRANRLYRESERMIANRSAQLEDMLRDLKITESAVTILNDLTAVAGEIGQTEGFGAVSQHYFNLRSGNQSRDAALATLRSRYGTRGAAPGPSQSETSHEK